MIRTFNSWKIQNERFFTKVAIALKVFKFSKLFHREIQLFLVVKAENTSVHIHSIDFILNACAIEFFTEIPVELKVKNMSHTDETIVSL